MIQIRELHHLQGEDLRKLNVGYTSPGRYRVSKRESPQNATITLKRVQFEQPYVKQWETDNEELIRYQAFVKEGMSLAAYDRDKMVAIALAESHRWNRSLWIWEFHVDAEYQRQGIGRRLMEYIADKARSAHLRVLVVEVQNTNLHAIDFYRAVGFEIEGIDLSYYTNHDLEDGEIAIFMKRKLE
jgi:ribosomal protein S18 acetylase RimI-like enzyme